MYELYQRLLAQRDETQAAFQRPKSWEFGKEADIRQVLQEHRENEDNRQCLHEEAIQTLDNKQKQMSQRVG